MKYLNIFEHELNFLSKSVSGAQDFASIFFILRKLKEFIERSINTLFKKLNCFHWILLRWYEPISEFFQRIAIVFRIISEEKINFIEYFWETYHFLIDKFNEWTNEDPPMKKFFKPPQPMVKEFIGTTEEVEQFCAAISNDTFKYMQQHWIFILVFCLILFFLILFRILFLVCITKNKL